ncbi:hypothetical protein AtEden1_Chr5g0153071 [Arabidopsis thaliana]
MLGLSKMMPNPKTQLRRFLTLRFGRAESLRRQIEEAIQFNSVWFVGRLIDSFREQTSRLRNLTEF